MIELYIKEARLRERERVNASARVGRLRIVRTLERWLGEEKVNALGLEGVQGQWYVTLQVPHRFLPIKRTLRVQAPFWADPRQQAQCLEVMRDGNWELGKIVQNGDEFLVALGELR